MQNSTQTRRKATALSLASISCLAVVALGGAPAAAESQSRPALTIAPFVLKSTILGEEGTNAYRPWFENRKWTGDLIEYEIFSTGQRCTSVAVGEFPPDDSGNAASCTDADGVAVQNWSARGAYPDLVMDPVTGTTSDDPLMESYWENRNLFFYSPGTTTNTEELRWSNPNLSAIQKQALDPETCDGLTDGECSSGLIADGDSIILNYIRGDRSLETDRGGILRRRFSLLGAIINSRPVYVPAGDGLVMVGSNGGIVHGFNAQDGSETFGYVPSQFMAHLRTLTDPQYDYNFRFFADGELRYAKTSNDEHIVAGGLGSGGKGLFIMDVSTPDTPRILLELSGTAGDHIPQVHNALGFIHGRPSIAQLPDGQWYVVTGNGFGSGAGAQLLLIPLTATTSGAVIPITTGALGAANGLAAPALVDSNNDGRVDYAYAGDLEGNLWRFGLAVGSRSSTRVFNATTDVGVPQPITAEPEIARHPTQVGVMVYFGTGQLQGFLDADDVTQQSVYGIWDPAFNAANVSRNDLYPQTLTEKEGDWTGEPRLVRVIENENPSGPDWAEDGDMGWRVDLPRAGERLLGRPQARADRLQFITNNPTYDVDSVGYQSANWINQLSLASGGSLNPPESLYDLDRNGNLDEGDLYVETVGDSVLAYYPLGLNLGPGIISQPAFARVTTNIDAVFINGVIMLPPPESDPNLIQGGGDLDVTTDSPAGPLVNPHLESHPNFNPSYPDFASSPWSNLPGTVEARGPMNRHLSADGFGGNVDGHHRAYNRVHGVSYVDFFDIEPRAQRGLLRLDPGTVDENTGDPFTAIRELNQPSEDLNGARLVAGDQKFIVVLTNADLSQGTELKIGCRTWATFDYQNMVTRQLREGRAPASLVDEDHGNQSLVFTLDEIDPSIADLCEDESEPTLRISLTGRVGDEHPTSGQDVLIATLPGCVNNTHELDGRIKEPGRNPHITRVENYPTGSGSTGYRWRNGALTMQLLRVTDESNADDPGYVLQQDGLPEGRRGAFGVIGAGGIYAEGFYLRDGVVQPCGEGVEPLCDGDNGLLYEASLFWNYGDMKEFQQEGQDLVCFGDNQWASFRGTEWDGLNSSQYNALVDALRGEDNELKDQYIQALSLLQSETTVEEGLRLLAQMFGTEVGSWARGRDPEYASLLLGYYDRMRSYANRANLNLLDIDQDLFQLPPPPVVLEDLTPAGVDDVEVDLLPAAGPNFAPGRRSWIDLTPN